MDEGRSLDHTRWEYKYHVIFIPKYRRNDDGPGDQHELPFYSQRNVRL